MSCNSNHSIVTPIADIEAGEVGIVMGALRIPEWCCRWLLVFWREMGGWNFLLKLDIWQIACHALQQILCATSPASQECVSLKSYCNKYYIMYIHRRIWFYLLGMNYFLDGNSLSMLLRNRICDKLFSYGQKVPE